MAQRLDAGLDSAPAHEPPYTLTLFSVIMPSNGVVERAEQAAPNGRVGQQPSVLGALGLNRKGL
jgi:hypothetical protein